MNVLKHYGVSGMEWGKRKQRESSLTGMQVLNAREKEIQREKNATKTAAGKQKAEEIVEHPKVMNAKSSSIPEVKITLGENIINKLFFGTRRGGRITTTHVGNPNIDLKKVKSK